MSHHSVPLTSFPLAETEDRTVDDVSDEILVSLAIDGDRDAFGRLARRHRQLAFRAAALVVGRERAEDVVQDALLLAFRTLPTLRERAKFPRWLATIARFRALRMSQDERRHRARTVQLDSLSLATLSDLACAPRETGTGDDVLRPALARIPPAYAEVIRLHYFHGFPHQKIADFLAVPVATIRWRCFRGKELLRNVLRPGGSAATCLDEACMSCSSAAACEGHRKANGESNGLASPKGSPARPQGQGPNMRNKKRTLRLAAGPALILALAGSAWADEKADSSKHPAAVAAAQDGGAIKSQKEKRSYALGVEVGKDLRKQSMEVDPDLFLRGLKDAVAGTGTLLTEEEIRLTMAELQAELKRKQSASEAEKVLAQNQRAEKNKTDGEAFLAANNAREGVVTLESGLQYRILKAGDGKRPSADDEVVCQYRGTLLDGTEFDSSYKRNRPATFPLKGVIKGWAEALQLMPVGSTWQLFIPAYLAYGERGQPRSQIGPNATLVFEVELVSIQKPSGGRPTG